jgi:hypothetical protein
MAWPQTIDNGPQRFNRDRHPPGVGVEQAFFVDHETDMARKKYEVAALLFRVDWNEDSQRFALLIAVTRARDTAQ